MNTESVRRREGEDLLATCEPWGAFESAKRALDDRLRAAEFNAQDYRRQADEARAAHVDALTDPHSAEEDRQALAARVRKLEAEAERLDDECQAIRSGIASRLEPLALAAMEALRDPVARVQAQIDEYIQDARNALQEYHQARALAEELAKRSPESQALDNAERACLEAIRRARAEPGRTPGAIPFAGGFRLPRWELIEADVQREAGRIARGDEGFSYAE